MQLKKYQIIVLSIFFFFACALAFLVIATILVQVAVAYPQSPISIQVRESFPTPTLNIYQPIASNDPGKTEEQFEDEIPAAEVTAGTLGNDIETFPQPEQTPTPVPTISSDSMPQKQVNILLLGSDWRPESGYRTDVIMLLSINPQHKAVSVVSFPRDLYVQIPGWEMNRINTAHQVGGFELLADTFEYNFGIRPDYYFMVNFQGFKALVDSLDGIDVNASENLSDSCSDINNIGWCSVGPGMVHMDSTMALWYVRSRHSTSDFDRTRRAQEVTQAIFNKALSLYGLSRIPEMYSIYTDYVETNMGLGEILPLIPMATVVQNPENIHRYAIGPEHGYDWITETGAWVFIPDYYAIYDVLAEALYLNE
jgi:LCP family protein required for cell wall assembly